MPAHQHSRYGQTSLHRSPCETVTVRHHVTATVRQADEVPEAALIFRHHFCASAYTYASAYRKSLPNRYGRKERRSHSSTFRVTGFAYCMMFPPLFTYSATPGVPCLHKSRANRRGCRAQGKPQPDAHGWRELQGEAAKPERANDRKITADGRRDRVTAAAKRTLASTPARLRWSTHSPHTALSHITENP